MMHSESIGKLTESLVKVQGSIEGAKKDSENPFFKSKYADLGAVWDACREQLVANGLAVAQTNSPSENGITVNTILMHSSGEWLEGSIFIPVAKSDPQAYGSAMTYARRYALAAMIGIYQEDDDAEGGVDREKKTKKSPLEILLAELERKYGPDEEQKDEIIQEITNNKYTFTTIQREPDKIINLAITRLKERKNA